MRRIPIVFAVCVALIGVGLGAVPAEAAGVKIKKIYWDSPGPDYGSNSSLNAEYVVIKNTSSSRKSLSHWKIADRDGHRYIFPTGFHLAGGAVVRVHSGQGNDGAHDLYWDYGNYVWTNDPGDKAKLRNRDGDIVDKCGYTSSSPNPKRC